MVQDVKCCKCGGSVCVCSIEDGNGELWTAHCMDCDNEIGIPCVSEEDAYDLWVEENSLEMEEAVDSKRAMGIVGVIVFFIVLAIVALAAPCKFL